VDVTVSTDAPVSDLACALLDVPEQRTTLAGVTRGVRLRGVAGFD
jgi:hypothetical protein